MGTAIPFLRMASLICFFDKFRVALLSWAIILISDIPYGYLIVVCNLRKMTSRSPSSQLFRRIATHFRATITFGEELVEL